ncbi:MAG: response regulator, partial [Geobacteraceae bacterium]|nr:response regulator [Geobacteraceae bacterium]
AGTAVMADPGQMHQVIMNLCTNALHAMEEQERGEIRIRLKTTNLDPANALEEINLAPGTYVELQVQDNGGGIDDEAKQRIFEPYFSTRKNRGGTGLGLAVVHGIIKDFNGSIRVDSTPGEGSVFTLLLPAVNAEDCAADEINAMQEKTTPPSQENTQENSRGLKHVLVVDDEESMLNLMKGILEKHGYAVTCTTSSPHALEMFEKHGDGFDILITDYAMPAMSGIELAQEVRNIRSDIPVLMCSGYYADREKRGAQEAGIEIVLNKPIQDYQLTLALDNILSA